MLDQKGYLNEAVDMLPAEKVMVDSTFAFEGRTRTGRRGRWLSRLVEMVTGFMTTNTRTCLRVITVIPTISHC
jgi:hypothetical protein